MRWDKVRERDLMRAAPDPDAEDRRLARELRRLERKRPKPPPKKPTPKETRLAALKASANRMRRK